MSCSTQAEYSSNQDKKMLLDIIERLRAMKHEINNMAQVGIYFDVPIKDVLEASNYLGDFMDMLKDKYKEI